MQPSYLPLPHKKIILWTYKQQRVLHTSDSSAAIHFFPPASESRMNTAAVFCLEANYKLFTKLEDRLYAEKGVTGKSWWANDLPKSKTNQADGSYSIWASGSTHKKEKTLKTSMQTFPILSVSSTLGRSVHNKKLLQFSLNESGFHINFNFIKFNLLLTVWLTQKK